MFVQILGGVLKGQRIKLPDKLRSIVRPTQTLLKRRFFDSFQNFSKYQFFDLCAGSGAIGFEAVSRGAIELTLIEKNRKLCDFLGDFKKQIIPQLDYCEAVYIKCKNVLSLKDFLANAWEQSPSCFFYLDPPYKEIEIYKRVFRILESSENDQNFLIVEFPDKFKKEIDDLSRGWKREKEFVHGGKSILCLRKRG